MEGSVKNSDVEKGSPVFSLIKIFSTGGASERFKIFERAAVFTLILILIIDNGVAKTSTSELNLKVLTRNYL